MAGSAAAEALQHAKAADAVERTLANRPSAEELKQQHIVVTPVQAKAEALQHAKAADAVERTLLNRPSVGELKQQHIIVTPVQAKAEALQHAKAADALEKSLSQRASQSSTATSSNRFFFVLVIFLMFL